MAEADDEGPTVGEAMAEIDLDALFARVKNGDGTKWDHDHFDAAMMYRYCQRVHAGEDVEPWIMAALANAFFKVLAGGEWRAEIRLPDREPEPIRPWRQQRDLEIFCAVANAAADGHDITHAIDHVANVFNVSYPSARNAYYTWRKYTGTDIDDMAKRRKRPADE